MCQLINVLDVEAVEEQQNEEVVEDPFLELAIASETEDYETLLRMAKSALATSEASMVAAVDPQILAHFTMIAPPPVVEKPAIVKKQYLVESSDNDLGGELIADI